MSRLNKYDTLKGILILLVLFGHLLEAQPSARVLYILIYSFHMPLFMYIAGRFAKFNPPRALYFIALFFLFYAYKAWFVMTLGVYLFTVPLLNKIKTPSGRAILLTASIIVGFLSGFVPWLDLTLSGARIFTFFPYFIVGYYQTCEQKPVKKKTALLFGVGLTVASIAFAFLSKGSAMAALWMNKPYTAYNYPCWMRLIAYALGLLWIYCLLHLTTDKKVPVLTTLGQDTLWIYLLHLPLRDIVEGWLNTRYSLLLAIAVAIVECMVLWAVSHYLNKLEKFLFKKLNTWIRTMKTHRKTANS